MTKSTKDYGTLLEWACGTAGPNSHGINELADAVDDLLSRLPVVPVPAEIATLRKARSAVYAEFDGKPVPDNAIGAIDRAGRAIGKLINALEDVVVPEYEEAAPWELVGVDKP